VSDLPTTAQRRCAATVVARLSPAQKVGQLVLVGLKATTSPTALDPVLADSRVSGVFYLGSWTAARSRSAIAHLHAELGDGIPLLIAADQEGGKIQRLTGPGLATMPSAVVQGGLDPQTLRADATTWARQLTAAGVDVDLAPVSDTVPTDAVNAPIGSLDRELGHDPATVASHVAALVSGLQAGGVAATVKHFPGLGRVRNNTDTSATGITDTVTTVDDAYLAPFATGVDGGVGMVMVSLATYTRIDAASPAVFSGQVIEAMLRDRLGFTGVVVSDDLDAKALTSVPVADRAWRFVQAGGDLALVSHPADVAPMTTALLDKMAGSTALTQAVTQAAQRVVALKVRLGLVRCTG